jgi:glyoxylase-like metal-dependent hydrolase (beta-lactamase superfamily II)
LQKSYAAGGRYAAVLTELDRDLYRIRGSFGSNIYLIADNGLALVDAGFPVDLPLIHLGLRALGATPRDIDLVIATHYHGDHTGTLAGMQKRYGVEVAIHEEDAPLASGELPQYTCEASLSRLIFYTLTWPLFRYRHFRADRLLKEGDIIDVLGGLEVLHMPGHSEGSICLYGGRRTILFSGDLVRNENGILEGPPPHFTPDTHAASRSLRRVHGLDFDLLLPGHGEVITGGAGERFRARVSEGTIWPLGLV